MGDTSSGPMPSPSAKGSWSALFTVFLVLSLGAAAIAFGLLPASLAKLATPIVFFGAAAPVLRRLSPTEPALLKWVLFSCLLSPVLLLVLWLMARVLLPGALAADPFRAPLGVAFAVIAVLQVVGIRGERQTLVSAPRAPAGPAARGALALSLVFGAAAAFALFGEASIRASFHGLLHASIAEATAGGVPPENPWLAGGTLQYYWVWHMLGSLVAGSLQIASTVALATLNVWSAFCLPLALYFLGAPLWRDARRDLGGVLLALLGLNALGGWLWLWAQRPFEAPTNPLDLLNNLAGSVGEWDRRLAWGPSKFGNLSSYPASLALLVGGWLASAHALTPRELEHRSSLRIWSLLAALCLGASFAINPLVGAVGFGSAGLVLLYNRDFSAAKLELALFLGLGALPGILQVLGAGSGREGESVGFGFSSAALWGTLAPVLPLLLASLVLVFRRDGAGTKRDRPRHTVLLLLVCASALSLLLATFVVLPEDNQYKFVRIAQVTLALLAAGGIGELLCWRGAGLRLARTAGLALIVLVAVGSLATTILGARSYAAWSLVPMALVETAGGIVPAGSSDLARSMVWLRESSPELVSENGRGVLLLNPPPDGGQGPVYGDARFSNAFNLQGHEAAAFSGLTLFVDRKSYLVEADPRWAPRLQLVRAFFAGDSKAIEGMRSALASLGRPLLLLRQGPPLPGGIEAALGFVPCAEFGDFTILADSVATKCLDSAASQ